MLGLIIISTVLIMMYVYIHRGRSNTRKYLPSPFQIPVIGHLYLMRKYPKEPWKVFDELTREYGEIYKLRLGQCDFVIITGIDSAKDILLKNGNSCLDRPLITSWDVLLKDQQNGLHFANWSMLHQNIRKILLGQMLSGNQIELDHFNEISEGGIKQFVSSGFPKNSLDFNQLATLYYRIILDYTCGTNFLAQPMSTDRKFDAAFQASLDVHDVALEGKIVDVFPFLEPFKFLFPQMRLLWDSNNTFMSFMLKEVGLEKIKHSLERNIAHKGDLTGYTTLAEILIKKHIENASNFSWTKCAQVIAAVVGGFVPMSMLTMVCLNYISLNKKYQEKIYQEIQEIESISEYELIPLENAQKLVYIEAALLEVARLSCSPYLPRYTTENMVIKGYNIPKNTGLLVNVYSQSFTSTVGITRMLYTRTVSGAGSGWIS